MRIRSTRLRGARLVGRCRLLRVLLATAARGGQHEQEHGQQRAAHRIIPIVKMPTPQAMKPPMTLIRVCVCDGGGATRSWIEMSLTGICRSEERRVGKECSSRGALDQ